MGLLDRLRGADDEDDALEQRRDADIARIEAGGIPLAAENRLRQRGGAFTSGLSVADFALTRGAGIRPVCQVMGSCVYKVGWRSTQWAAGFSSGARLIELDQLTHAWNDARRRALDRLATEAEHAGCHAVVDVTFEHRRHAFLAGEIEIVVSGTAVNLPEGGDQPILTDLSLPDFVLLRQAGYAPVGVVTSSSVFYIVPSAATRRATGGWQRLTPNQELPEYTQGIYEARENALARATVQAQRLHAAGMVGMQLEHGVEIREVDQNNQKREDLIVTFHVLGTAIGPHGAHVPLDPQTIVRLGGSKP